MKQTKQEAAKFNGLTITGCRIQVGPEKADNNQAAIEAMKAATALAEAIKAWAQYAPLVVNSSGAGIHIGDGPA